jgi:hypothetical protein
MGGSLSFIARLTSGKIIRRTHYTGMTTGFVKNVGLFADPDKWLRTLTHHSRFKGGYIKDWRTCPIAPTGYGITVVDAKKKHITTMQGFSDLRTHFLTGVRIWVRQGVPYANGEPVLTEETIKHLDQFEDAGSLRDWWAQGRVDGFRDLVTGKTQTPAEYVGKGEKPTYLDFLRVLMARDGTDRSLTVADLDYHPWTITRLKENQSDTVREMLLEDGFVLDGHDIDAWSAWKRRGEE